MSFVIKSGYKHNLDEHEGSDRFDYWREVVNKEFVNLTCDPHKGQNLDDFNSDLRGGLSLGQVQFSEIKSDRQLVKRTPAHISKLREDDFLISFQIKNSCTVKQKGRKAILTPGSFALYDSTEPYSLNFPDEFHQFVLQMPRDVLSKHLLEPEKYTAISIDASNGLGLVLKDFLFSLVNEISTSKVPPSEQLSENLVNLIALSFSSSVFQNELVDADSVKAALKSRILMFIESNLFDPKLNNSRIALSQGISERYLYKLFQDQEESIHEMILNKRLAAAHDLLRSKKRGKLTLESIAYYVGFSGAPHFSRSFKLKYGVCPSSVS